MINVYLNMISQTEIRRSNTFSFGPGDQNVWTKRNFGVGKTCCGRNLPLTQENKIFVSSEPLSLQTYDFCFQAFPGVGDL